MIITATYSLLEMDWMILLKVFYLVIDWIASTQACLPFVLK